MTIPEAMKVAEKIRDALIVLESTSGGYERLKENNKNILEQRNELKAELSKLKSECNFFRILAKYTTVEICPMCHGEGGWSVDMGEAGGDGGPCDTCATEGVVPLSEDKIVRLNSKIV